MYRRFLGGIVFLLMFVQTVSAAVVPINVLFKINDEEGHIAMGSGTVVSCKNGKSIIVTAGHLFRLPDMISIQILGREGTLLYNKCPEVPKTGEEDLAIIEVEASWKPLWKLEKEIDKEALKCSGYRNGTEKLPITTSGFCSINKHLVNECLVIPGMSGGPILAIRNGKYVWTGVIVGNTTKNVIMSVMGNPPKLESLEDGNAFYVGEEIIRKRLNEFAPGWDK